MFICRDHNYVIWIEPVQSRTITPAQNTNKQSGKQVLMNILVRLLLQHWRDLILWEKLVGLGGSHWSHTFMDNQYTLSQIIDTRQDNYYRLSVCASIEAGTLRKVILLWTWMFSLLLYLRWIKVCLNSVGVSAAWSRTFIGSHFHLCVCESIEVEGWGSWEEWLTQFFFIQNWRRHGIIVRTVLVLLVLYSIDDHFGFWGLSVLVEYWSWIRIRGHWE